MIVFDLACGQGHIFEAWFGSTEDYDGQQARGLVTCPICGDGETRKAVMAPAVQAKGNRAVARPLPPPAAGPAPAEIKAMLTALARAQAKALAGSEHVGGRFSDEARAMHLGDAPERPIHGQATIAQAKALIEEGVPVLPLPLPVVPPDVSH